MKHLPTLLVAIVLSMPAFATSTWHTDFATAQKLAKAENKPIVLDFTGSDWCGWCITMRRQVLDTPEFLAYARETFVLMEVDLPHNTAKMTPQQLQQNRELMQRYQVEVFPTVLVISPDGELLGGFAGGRTDLPSVRQPLELACTNAALLQQAATQNGTEKAETLHRFYRNIPARFRKNMPELAKQIAALDPQNVTGIHTELQELAVVQDITDRTRTMNNDEAIPVITEALPEVSGTRRDNLLRMLSERLNSRIQHLRENADTLADIEAMRQDNLLLIRYCVPEKSQYFARERVNSLFCNPQELLEQLRHEREERLKYKK